MNESSVRDSMHGGNKSRDVGDSSHFEASHLNASHLDASRVDSAGGHIYSLQQYSPFKNVSYGSGQKAPQPALSEVTGKEVLDTRNTPMLASPDTPASAIDGRSAAPIAEGVSPAMWGVRPLGRRNREGGIRKGQPALGGRGDLFPVKAERGDEDASDGSDFIGVM